MLCEECGKRNSDSDFYGVNICKFCLKKCLREKRCPKYSDYVKVHISSCPNCFGSTTENDANCSMNCCHCQYVANEIWKII